MSGRKQHFIPQSLLRAFGTQKGKKTYVVAYTFDRGVFAPPTDGIGAERSFYSELDVEETTGSLDDKITDYEQQIPAVLDQLRQVSEEAAAAVAAELVTHLTVRNDHFRKATATGGADLIGGMTEALCDEVSARALMAIAGEQPSETFAAELTKLWEQFGPMFSFMGMTQAQFNDFTFQAMKSNFSTFHAEMVGPLRETFARMVEKIPDVAANAQRRVLMENLTPPKRVERLAEFKWQTVETTEALILPDCVAVGRDAENALLPLMLADLEKTEAVFMPLASDRMLVGFVGEPPEVPQDINEVFAWSSSDFFVACDRTPELEGYRSLLRQTSERFMASTVSEVIEESLSQGRPALVQSLTTGL